MKSKLYSAFYHVGKIASYVTQTILSLVVQLAGLLSLFLVVFAVPLIIYNYFSGTVLFVRQWLESYANDSLFELFSLLGDGATFLGIVAALSIAPYFFTKAAESIPKSLSSILTEFRTLCKDQWLPRYQSVENFSHLGSVTTNRLKGLRNTVIASVGLIVSFGIIAVAVAWAVMESARPEVEAVVTINGETVTSVISEGTVVDIRCEDDSGNVMPPAEQVANSGISNRMFFRCQNSGDRSSSPVDTSASLESLSVKLNRLNTYIRTLPTSENLNNEIQAILTETDEHLNRHLNLMTERIDLLEENLGEHFEAGSP